METERIVVMVLAIVCFSASVVMMSNKIRRQHFREVGRVLRMFVIGR